MPVFAVIINLFENEHGRHGYWDRGDNGTGTTSSSSVWALVVSPVKARIRATIVIWLRVHYLSASLSLSCVVEAGKDSSHTRSYIVFRVEAKEIVGDTDAQGSDNCGSGLLVLRQDGQAIKELVTGHD